MLCRLLLQRSHYSDSRDLFELILDTYGIPLGRDHLHDVTKCIESFYGIDDDIAQTADIENVLVEKVGLTDYIPCDESSFQEKY